MSARAIVLAAATFLVGVAVQGSSASSVSGEITVSAVVPATAGTCLIGAPGADHGSPARQAPNFVVSCSGNMPYEVTLDAKLAGAASKTLECGTTGSVPASTAEKSARDLFPVTYACPSWSKLTGTDNLLDTINATLRY